MPSGRSRRLGTHGVLSRYQIIFQATGRHARKEPNIPSAELLARR